MTYPQGPQQPYGGYPQQQQGYPQQQSGYPPQQGYPPQPGGYPGYPPPQPPRKKNTGLIVALSALGAAAVIAVVLVIVLSGKDDSSPSADGVGTGGKPDVSVPGPNGGKTSGGSKPSGGSSGGSTGARELAEQAVDIINSHDASAMAGLTCDSNATKELTQALGTLPASATATLGDVKEQGSYGQAIIKITMSGKSQTVSLEMSKHGSKWCAAGL